MASAVHRAPDWGPARRAPHTKVAARRRAGGGAMARAGGGDPSRGPCEPLGGEHLPALCPGPMGRPLAATIRTRRCDHRAVLRRFHRGLRTPGRRRTVLERTAGTYGAVQFGAAS